MIDEKAFVPSQINLGNLDSLSSDADVISKRRLCEISEIADAATNACVDFKNNGLDVYEILSLLSEGVAFDNTNDKIFFAKILPERLKKRGISFTEFHFLSEAYRPQTFIYVKNTLSDEAYDIFSQEFSSPRLRYAANMREAVKAVSDGEVGYCLLPLEERGGARLASVADLIFGNNLKINSVTPVFGQDGNADMKYALVSKCFSVPKVLEDDDRYLEISLPFSEAIGLDEILYAAKELGISPYRVNTVSFYTEDGLVPNYSIVFRDDGGDFTSLLTYLTLYSREFVPIGIYKNLE